MNNLEIYAKVKDVPETAQKKIGGGRLKGMTDINPMWRIQVLTETFGPCGVGWRYTIDRQWAEEGTAGDKAAFVNVSLFVKINGEWSEAIPGTGGNMLVSKETSGLRTNDEGYKMALTDALSVACKALGVGASVYWSGDRTKYDTFSTETNEQGRNSNKLPENTTVANKAEEIQTELKIFESGKRLLEGVENVEDLSRCKAIINDTIFPKISKAYQKKLIEAMAKKHEAMTT